MQLFYNYSFCPLGGAQCLLKNLTNIMIEGNKATLNLSQRNVLQYQLIKIYSTVQSSAVGEGDDMLLNYSAIIYLELIQLWFY